MCLSSPLKTFICGSMINVKTQNPKAQNTTPSSPNFISYRVSSSSSSSSLIHRINPIDHHRLKPLGEMGKKRKSVATSLDEVDRSMYTSFCSAANSLSQLYTQAMNHQKLSFQAGERHALDKIYQWICRQQEGGSRVGTGDIINYLQNELDYCGEEPSMSPRVGVQHQHTPSSLHFTNSGFPISSGSSAPNTGGHGIRSEQCDHQSKNSVFSNALSSPVRQSLQHYHISYPGTGLPSARNNEPNLVQPSRDANPPSSNDSSMDMHADSPGHY